jgi:hypothetical protein
MRVKKKLVLIESEMKEPKGHFLNNLIDITNYYKKKFEIYWILNKDFKSKGTFIPNNQKIIKSIKSNTYKRNLNRIPYIIEEIYFLFLNIFDMFYFLFFFIKKKKFKNYIIALRSNYFLLPRYFKSFYKSYKSLKLTKNDHIFFPTSRRKDIALINFLTKIDDEHPKFHLRLTLMPKKRFKGFFYYLKEIDEKLRNGSAFIYLLTKSHHKLILKNSLHKKGIFISNLQFSYNPLSKYKRKFKKKNHVVGFVGNARRSRGFQHLPNLINLLEKKDKSLFYLIQFSNASEDLKQVKAKLYDLAKKNNRIKIIEKYVNHNEYVGILKKIDIMPILHQIDEINNVTSGTLFSCLPYEIPFITFRGLTFLKDITKYKSSETAIDLKNFAHQTIKITKKYSFYLKNAKRNNQILKIILNNDSIKKNFI